MNKSVLIIKGFSNNEEELVNDRKIIQLYIDFFASNAGGCFDSDTEIFVFEDPDLDTIKSLKFLNTNDYLIVVLVGHGATKDGVQIFHLNETTIIQSGQIQFDCKRQLHIIESCRNILDIEIDIQRFNDLIPKYKYGGVVLRPLTREESLKKFNDLIRTSKEGTTYLFASSLDESAYGYYFLQELMNTSRYIHEYRRGGVYGVLGIFDHIKKKVTDLSDGKQHPVKIGDVDFPFVVTII